MNYYLLVVDVNDGTIIQEGPFDTASERDEMAEEMSDDQAGPLVWLNITSTGVLKTGVYGEYDEIEDSEDDDDDDDDEDDLDVSKEDTEDDAWS